MIGCDCGAAPGFLSRHEPSCPVVNLNRRPRIDCASCELDDQPQALDSWFRNRDWCAHCEDNYEPPDVDGEDFRGDEASAYMTELQDAAQRLK